MDPEHNTKPDDKLMMNAIPDYATFAGLLNSTFTVQTDDGQSIEVQLVKISEQQLAGRQEIFSIIFRGPGDIALGQALLRFHHEDTGDFDLFITPLRQDQEGLYYEAVFNLIREPVEPAT
jgi:hypothetical protein